MLLDLAKLALQNLLCILGLAEERSSPGIARHESIDAFEFEPNTRAFEYDFGEAEENIAMGYGGVQNGDQLNQAAYAVAESAKDV